MEQKQLFPKTKPLTELLRPKKLEDFIGIIDFNEKMLSINQSLILWGPPGSGKTTLARIISEHNGLPTVILSGVVGSTADFRSVFKQAESGIKTTLVIDEIHHLNKLQQDLFLPHIESGNIILIGTTTENPSFELRPALLSRCKVIIFKRLSIENLSTILNNAEQFLGIHLKITAEAKQSLCYISDGDARYLLNRVEEISKIETNHDLNVEELSNFIHKKLKTYDKNADEHYNLISAFHKSIRGSDVNAALYWFARMIHGGEDPLYIARRLVRAATEDVGLAEPMALQVSMSAVEAYKLLGSPEGLLAIAEAIIFVATCPKSNAAYNAYNKSMEYVAKTGSIPPPKHIINAPTKFMKAAGFGDGYIYDHDTPNAFSGQNYFPDEIQRQSFYKPNERGFEREIKKRIDWWESRKLKTSK